MKTELDVHIEDYDKNRWQDDFVANNSNHEQPGDPVKLSRLVYEVSTSANPPLHLPVGKDGVETVEGLINKLEEDLKDWKEKSVNTNFEE